MLPQVAKAFQRGCTEHDPNILQAQSSIDRRAGDDEGCALTDSLATFAIDVANVLRPQNLPDPKVAETHVAGADEPHLYADFPEGARFGRFRLVRTLGHGSFGVVLLAFDPQLQRQVALKLPRPDKFGASGWNERLLHEARAVAALDHQGIVPVYEVGHHEAIWYITSAFCDGPDLKEWQRTREPVPIELAVRIAVQIADAMNHAHSRGVLHRDLKPANILLKLPVDENGPLALVTDFGLASRCDGPDDDEASVGLVGTLPYMAPEQTFDVPAKVGTAADIYGVGAILFEMLVGRAPFVAAGKLAIVAEIQATPAPKLRQLRKDVPRDLEAICAKCLQKSPEDRYESAAALRADLARFLQKRCVAARKVGPLERTWRWCMRRPAVATLSLATIAAVVLGAVASLAEWRRAEANLTHAEEAVINLSWAIDDSTFWANPHDSISPAQRDSLTRRYFELLRKLDGHSESEAVHATAACFLARLDDLAGNYELAGQHFEQSLRSWCNVVRRFPEQGLYRQAFTRSLYCLGNHRRLVQQQPDGLSRNEGGKLLGQLDWNSKPDREIAYEYAALLFAMGEARRGQKQLNEAAAHFTACTRICRELAEADPQITDYRFLACQSELRDVGLERPRNVGYSPYDVRKNVYAELQLLVGAEPERHQYRAELAAAASWMASNAGRFNQSVDVAAMLREAIESLRPLVETNQSDRRTTVRYATLWLKLSRLLCREGRMTDSETSVDTALKWYRAAYGSEPQFAFQLAQATRSAAGVYLSCHAEAKALRSFRDAVHLYGLASGSSQFHHREACLHYADAWKNIASLEERDGRYSAAKESYEKALVVLRSWRGPNPTEPHVVLEIRRVGECIAKIRERDTETLK